MMIRKLALLTLTITALAVGGCSSESEPEVAPPATDEPSSLSTEPTETGDPSATAAPVVVHRKITRQVRRTHFPRSGADHRAWSSDIALTGSSGTTVSRRVLPCDDAEVDLRIDRRVLAHAEAVLEPDGYLVSRQLTLYPDPATADRFVSQLSESPIGCTSLMGSSDLGSVQRLDYGRDRFFGTQDRSVIFSETDLSYGENRFVFIDIINQRDNAILFTRVGTLNQRVRGSGVIMDKDKNPGFVRQVRAQADRATAILRQLSGS